MLLKRKNSQQSMNIELNDYIARILFTDDSLDETELIQIPLPPGIVKEGIIEDEMGLYELLKENLGKRKKKQQVRFFVPDASVLLKQIDIPENVTPEELRGYVEMEIGNSINIPFQEPLIDTYDPIVNDGKALMFCAPAEEVQKLMNICLDLHQEPEIADIRALCNLRVLEYLKLLRPKKTYLLCDWSLNDISICIYSNENVEFLRYQTIETDMEKWKIIHNNDRITFKYEGDIEAYKETIRNQIFELERIMDFFKFSLHQGDTSVDGIFVTGDNPFLTVIGKSIQANLQLPVHVLNDAYVENRFPGLKAAHVSLIGLALKVVDI